MSADRRNAEAWILADEKAGHTTQSVGLAQALGLRYEVKDLRFNALNLLSNRLLGASRNSLDRRRSASLVPPWPEVVISTGRRSAPVARWVARRSAGRTRVIQMGRKGGEQPATFDAVVSCVHFGLPPHPRRIETLAPLHAMSADRLAGAAERWRGLFGQAAQPHVVLVVGGSTAQHVLDPGTARRMGAEVRAFAEAAGGSIFAITSPRTGARVVEALCAGLGDSGRVHRWSPRQRDNPYVGYLALADVLVVTGESESMLAEAAATGAPLYIYPIPTRPAGPRVRLRSWVAAQARAFARNGRPTTARRRTLGTICARLIESGVVRPTRELALLHEGLIHAGFARRFGDSIETNRRAPLNELAQVAARVRALIRLPESEPADTADATAVTPARQP